MYFINTDYKCMLSVLTKAMQGNHKGLPIAVTLHEISLGKKKKKLIIVVRFQWCSQNLASIKASMHSNLSFSSCNKGRLLFVRPGKLFKDLMKFKSLSKNIPDFIVHFIASFKIKVFYSHTTPTSLILSSVFKICQAFYINLFSITFFFSHLALSNSYPGFLMWCYFFSQREVWIFDKP